MGRFSTMQTYINTTDQLVKALIKRRKELGISQTELAKLCNLSVNGITKFESHAGEREVKHGGTNAFNQG